MAATSTTQIKLKADDREIKKLGQTIGKAFDPKAAKELKQTTRDLERQFGEASKKQADLVRQLQHVEKGTKHYKALKEELKGVRDQADLAHKALGQIEQASQRLSRRQQESRGRNFTMGMAQGAGVAQYLPSGPGAYARMGGAMLGSGIRRGLGSAAAPFMTPGVGGMARGLAGIPIVGGFAAGALGVGAAAFQSTVGYDRARLQNLYFANQGIGQRRGQYVNPVWQAAQARLEDATSNRSRVTDEQVEIQKRSDDLKLIRSRERSARQQRALQRRRAALRNANFIQKVGDLNRAPGATARAAGLGAPRNTAEVEKDLIKEETRRNKAALDAANKEVGAASKALRGISKFKSGGVRSGLGSDAFAADLGIGPMQAQALRGQFYQQAGGLFEQREFNTAVAAQVRFGVGAQQAGGFARMGRAGGGGEGMMSLGRVLQGAFVQGLRGSQVVEYLSELVTLGQASEKQGIKINVSDYQKTTMRLKAAGLEGVQAGRVGAGLVRAGQGVAARGVQSPMDMLMLRAAGFQPGQGPEGYFKAQMALESGDSGTMSKIIGNLVQGTGGMGQYQRAGMVKRAFQQMGTPIGMKQAQQIIAGYQDGGAPDIDAILGRRDAMGGDAGMAREARRRVGAGAAFARTGAALERQRIGVGRGFGFIAKFESASLRSAKIISNFGESIGKVGTIVNRALGAVDKFTSGGMDGVLGKLASLLGLDLLGGGGKPPKAK